MNTTPLLGLLAKLQALIRLQPQTVPPFIASPGIGQGVAFDVTTPASRIFAPLSQGTVFSGALVYVITPFNAPATIELGTSADLGLLMGAADSDLTTADQYESDAIVIIPSNDVLVSTFALNGATVGAGYIFFAYLLP